MQPNAPIKFRVGCPSCHAKFLVAERMLGLSAKCPKCGSHFRIPARQSTATVAKPAGVSSPDKPVDQTTAETSGGSSDNAISTPQSQEVPGARGVKLALWAVVVVIVLVTVLGVLLGPRIPGSLSDRQIGMGIGDRTAAARQEAEARMAAEMAKAREQIQMQAPPPMPPVAVTDLPMRSPTVSLPGQESAGTGRGGIGVRQAGTRDPQGTGLATQDTPVLSPFLGRYSDGDKRWFVLSQDGKHYACVFSKRPNYYVLLDGQEGKSYLRINGLAISPDGKRVAYVAGLGKWGVEDYAVVVDGKEGPPYDGIGGTPIFSPDSKRVTYVGIRGNKSYVVVDGRQDQIHSWCVNEVKGLTFSPNSGRLAYVGRRSSDSSYSVVADGKIVGEHGRVAGAPIFSGDSVVLAYIAVHPSGGGLIFCNGTQVGPKYDGIQQMSYSPYGRRLSYVASHDHHAFVCLNGKELGEGRCPTFSPDGKRFAYVRMYENKGYDRKFAAVVDAVEHPQYDEIIQGRIVFSPDSKRVAYAARNRKEEVVVVDGQRCDALAFPSIRQETVVFSSDSQRVAYVALLAGKGESVILNGEPGRDYSQIEDGPYFSPDGRHVAYLAIEEDRDDRTMKHLLVVEGQGRTEYRFETPRLGMGEHVRLERRLFFDGGRAAYVWTVFDNAVHRIERQLSR